MIEVDATTGEVLDFSSRQAAIEQRAGELMATLPPFQPYTSVPEACRPQQVPRAPRLVLSDTDEPTLLSTNSN